LLLTPPLRELVASTSHDADPAPLRAAPRCRNSLPLLALRAVPSPSPHAFVACEKKIIQSVGGVGKGVEEVGHRLSPGFPPLQAPVTQPMRDQIFGHIFVE